MGAFDSYGVITDPADVDMLLILQKSDHTDSGDGTLHQVAVSDVATEVGTLLGPAGVGAVPAASTGRTAAPVVSLGSTSSQQGQWQELAEVSLTSQFFSAATALQVQGSGGPEQPTAATVRFAVKQDAALGSPPAIILNVSGCETIAPGNFWAVVTVNSGSVTTVKLYLQAPGDFESYEVREMASGLGGGTLTYGAGGSTWLTSLPAGAQQYGMPAPGTAAARDMVMTQWRAALANRHYAAQSITCIGTSVTAGDHLGAWEQSWPVRLQALLNARFPVDGLDTHGAGMLIPVLHDTGLTPDYVSVTGTPTVEYGYGCNGATYDISAGGGCTLAYSAKGTTAYIYYTQQSGGGTLGYQVDSGSVSTQSTSAGSTLSGQIIGPVTLDSTPGNSHTLTITHSSGGPVWVDAVVVYDGDESKGIMVFNAGSSGATTPGWASVDLHSLAQNFSPLWLIEVGANDWGVISPATFATDYGSLLTAIATAHSDVGAPAPAIGIIANYLQDYSTTDQWQEYVAAMYAVASANGCALLDLTQLMPPGQSGGGPFGLYYTDGQHPSAVGHAAIADLAASFLSPAA